MSSTVSAHTTSAKLDHAFSLQDTETIMQDFLFYSHDPNVVLLDERSMPWRHNTGKEYVREHAFAILGRALHLWASSTVNDFFLAHASLRGAAFGGGNLTQSQEKIVSVAVRMLGMPRKSNIDVHHVIHIAGRSGVFDTDRVQDYVMQTQYYGVDLTPMVEASNVTATAVTSYSRKRARCN